MGKHIIASLKPILEKLLCERCHRRGVLRPGLGQSQEDPSSDNRLEEIEPHHKSVRQSLNGESVQFPEDFADLFNLQTIVSLLN